MRRREFIAALGGEATWPVVARAQESGSVRRIAVIMGFPEKDPEPPWTENVSFLRF
jgi:hypothetical protein